MRPEVGQWYQIEGTDRFEVVAFDEEDGTIELQYHDGTVEEMDMEDWEAENDQDNITIVTPPSENGLTDKDDEDYDEDPLHDGDEYGSGS